MTAVAATINIWHASPIGSVANEMVANGIHLFPCHGITAALQCTCGLKNCRSAGKHPFTPHGLNDATDDMEKLVQLFNCRIDLNIGMACGDLSNVIVIDIDGNKGGWESLAKLEDKYDKLPDTPISITGNGEHRFFENPEVKIKSRANAFGKEYPGLDIRSDGGYVIIPPSWHANGKQYKWNLSKAESTPCMPQWLIDLLKQPQSKQTKPTIHNFSKDTLSEWSLEEVSRMLGHISPAIKRDEWLNVGFALHAEGFPLSMWDEWSQGAPDKYVTGECEKCWRGFDPAKGVTMGTLVNMAKHQGWRPTAIEREVSNTTAINGVVEKIKKNGDKKSKPVTGYDADALQYMEFPPIKYIVDGYIPEGLTIFAGRPKIGKSWAILDMAIAVATGGMALGGIPCVQGDVLYLALEDNLRRLKSRMEKLLSLGEAWPKALRLETQWPRLNAGGSDQIREWIESKNSPRLVIIDTLGKVRGEPNKQDSAYQADYQALIEPQTLAGEKGLAIVLVYHDRKADAEDPIDAVSGTLGLAGAADTILVLKRKPEGTTLYGRGRDIEEIETIMKFDKTTCKWSIVGDATEVKKSDERGEITKILDTDMKPMKPQEVADILRKKGVAVRQMMVRMSRDGDIQKLSYGKYASKNYVEADDVEIQGHTSHPVTVEEDPEEF